MLESLKEGVPWQRWKQELRAALEGKKAVNGGRLKKVRRYSNAGGEGWSLR